MSAHIKRKPTEIPPIQTIQFIPMFSSTFPEAIAYSWEGHPLTTPLRGRHCRWIPRNADAAHV